MDGLALAVVRVRVVALERGVLRGLVMHDCAARAVNKTLWRISGGKVRVGVASQLRRALVGIVRQAGTLPGSSTDETRQQQKLHVWQCRPSPSNMQSATDQQTA